MNILTNPHQQFFQNLLENSHVGAYLLDSENKISYISPQVEDILGYTTDEVLNKNIFDFIEEDFKVYFQKSVDSLLRFNTQKYFETEIKMQSKDKQSKHFYKKIINYDTQQKGTLLVYFQDITDQKITEEYFEETRWYLQAILDHTHYGFFLTSTNAKIMYFNIEIPIAICYFLDPDN